MYAPINKVVRTICTETPILYLKEKKKKGNDREPDGSTYPK